MNTPSRLPQSEVAAMLDAAYVSSMTLGGDDEVVRYEAAVDSILATSGWTLAEYYAAERAAFEAEIAGLPPELLYTWQGR